MREVLYRPIIGRQRRVKPPERPQRFRPPAPRDGIFREVLYRPITGAIAEFW